MNCLIDHVFRWPSQEIVHSADEDGDIEEEEYTPLTCDMCSQTFNRPSDWVRHIEYTHADMTENRRKKRKVHFQSDRVAAANYLALINSFLVFDLNGLFNLIRLFNLSF